MTSVSGSIYQLKAAELDDVENKQELTEVTRGTVVRVPSVALTNMFFRCDASLKIWSVKTKSGVLPDMRIVEETC